MRCLVAQSSLDDFDQYDVRNAWEKRGWHRIRWWFMRIKFWIKVRKIDAGSGCDKVTIALTGLEYDRWRARHAKA